MKIVKRYFFSSWLSNWFNISFNQLLRKFIVNSCVGCSDATVWKFVSWLGFHFFSTLNCGFSFGFSIHNAAVCEQRLTSLIWSIKFRHSFHSIIHFIHSVIHSIHSVLHSIRSVIHSLYSFSHAFYSFSHSFYSFSHAFYSFSHSFIIFIQSCILFIQSFILLIQSCILFIHSFIHSIHSIIHLLQTVVRSRDSHDYQPGGSQYTHPGVWKYHHCWIYVSYTYRSQ